MIVSQFDSDGPKRFPSFADILNNSVDHRLNESNECYLEKFGIPLAVDEY